MITSSHPQPRAHHRMPGPGTQVRRVLLFHARALPALLAAILPVLLLAPACAPQEGPPTDGSEETAAQPGTRTGGWRLAASNSPYLRQHADNAVQWYEWGDEAFALAKATDKPIFLSIGYSSCHWCHVMEHESFEDPEVAALLAEFFISVKMDREQRPDVDSHYMSAVQAMNNGRGGWPMSVFITPDGKPFFAGTYFPKDAKFGRPGFLQIVEQLGTQWREDRSQLTEYAGRVQEWLLRDVLADSDTFDAAAVLTATTSQLQAQFDETLGGYRGAPKFPPGQALSFLMRRHLRDGSVGLDRIITTLDGMAWGGMRDQVGGGFHRYSVDANWHIPHFEKMLYDNAQLLAVYAEAAALTGQARFADIARDTAAWAAKEMRSEAGIYFSAQDADSLPFRDWNDGHDHGSSDHPEEGRFYCWTPAELNEALGERDGKLAARVMHVSADGNFEHHLSHARLDRAPAAWANDLAEELGVPDNAPAGTASQAFDTWWSGVRTRLYTVRAPRPPPFLDRKCLSEWNGMMLTGLSRAALLLDDDELRQSAQNLGYSAIRWFLEEPRGPDPDLAHQVFEEVRSGTPTLSDHACLARGFLDAYEATSDATFLYQSLRLARALLANYEDTENGGFYDNLGDDPHLPRRTRDVYDGAVPSGTSVALEVLTRLSPLDDEGTFAAAVERSLARLVPMAQQSPRGFPTLLTALDAWHGPLAEIVLDGMPGTPAYDALLARARATCLPAALLIPVATDAALLADNLFDGTVPMLLDGREASAGEPTAWVCSHGVCQLPVSDPDALAAQLATLGGRPVALTP